MAEEKTESSSAELKEKIQFLTDENDHLHIKLGSTQSKVAQHAASTRDLSSRLVRSKQDKLQISKDLVEVQIEANKMREKYEAEIFELQNKVSYQEGAVSNLEAEIEQLKREIESASSRLQVAEGNERDMAEEYAALKSNFLTVSKGLESEIKHSQELNDELLMLAQTHDTLLQEKEREHMHTLELERGRALLSKVSHTAQFEMGEELKRMRKHYEEQQQRLEEKIVAMRKEQQENKRAICNTQQELAQQSATQLVSQHQIKEVEDENSKLQNQLKLLNQEYRARLTHYIKDITECVHKEDDANVKLKEYVDAMLKDVRVSYHSREEQLTSTLKNYRKRLHNLSNTHHLLLIAYRMQREQILERSGHGLEAGPPESHFISAEVELRGEPERELQRLKEDKSRLETQLRVAQKQVSLLSQPSQNAALTEEAWADVRKQLREITLNAQEKHEKERVALVTRATVAEQQVKELQEYIDNHLGRYKLEVTRLRRMLQLEVGRSQSTEAPKLRPLCQPLNKTSYEI